MNNSVEIVLVEDNASDAELVMRVLKKHNIGNQIIRLKDGAEAMEYLFSEGAFTDRANANPKVVLLDLKLPKVDGLEVLRRMKADERTKHIPVVALTSSTEERDLDAAYDLGINSYVTKPIVFSEFAKVVAELGVYWLMLNKLAGQ